MPTRKYFKYSFLKARFLFFNQQIYSSFIHIDPILIQSKICRNTCNKSGIILSKVVLELRVQSLVQREVVVSLAQAFIIQVDRSECCFRPEVLRKICRSTYLYRLRDYLFPYSFRASNRFFSIRRRQFNLYSLLLILQFILCFTLNSDYYSLIIILKFIN